MYNPPPHLHHLILMVQSPGALRVRDVVHHTSPDLYVDISRPMDDHVDYIDGNSYHSYGDENFQSHGIDSVEYEKAGYNYHRGTSDDERSYC